MAQGPLQVGHERRWEVAAACLDRPEVGEEVLPRAERRGIVGLVRAGLAAEERRHVGEDLEHLVFAPQERRLVGWQAVAAAAIVVDEAPRVHAVDV